MKKVDIYTDGACKGNPGPGGYGAILVYQGREKEVSGYEEATTNNRMELTAVIIALKSLKEPCEVKLTTDSKYIVDSVTKGWMFSWRSRGWRKSDGSPALNSDLWEELYRLLTIHQVKFEWVKGHNGHPYNERCDQLAVSEIENHLNLNKTQSVKHKVERVDDLMYKGCESHWHCINCNEYFPFHCYTKEEIESIDCGGACRE